MIDIGGRYDHGNSLMMKKPRVPLPPPQLGNIPNNWANRTISYRFARTIQSVLDENEYSREKEKSLKQLIDDIPNSMIRKLRDYTAPDAKMWEKYLEPYLNMDWYQPPWFFTEHYFYRRILEAVNYFSEEEISRNDPFGYQKRIGLESSNTEIRNLWNNLDLWLKSDVSMEIILERLFLLDLWGNQADLSLWPADQDVKPDHPDPINATSHILANDTQSLINYINKNKNNNRIDFLIDNAGFELVCDLHLADFLLSNGYSFRIVFHVKKHPTYVSDAIEKNVFQTLKYLISDTDETTSKAGSRLLCAIKNGKLNVAPNWFWNSPKPAWDMPKDLWKDISQAALVISKGDANYRRLLGDRQWSYTMPFKDVMSYFPSPITALRTLKSELAIGLEEGQAEEISQVDNDWLINGRWGMVQLCHY